MELISGQETLETKKGRPDVGVRLGDKLLGLFSSKGSSHVHHHYKTVDDEADSVTSDSSEDEGDVASVKEDVIDKAPPMLDALTPQSTLNIVYYICLALHAITFDQLCPVMMAYPPQDSSTFKLPFRFSGGLGMSSSEIGKMFSIYGMVGMFLQVRRDTLKSPSIGT